MITTVTTRDMAATGVMMIATQIATHMANQLISVSPIRDWCRQRVLRQPDLLVDIHCISFLNGTDLETPYNNAKTPKQDFQFLLDHPEYPLTIYPKEVP